MTAVTLIIVISYLIGIGTAIEIVNIDVDRKWYKILIWGIICIFVFAISPIIAFVKLGGNIWNQD